MRSEDGFTAKFDDMLAEPILIRYYDDVGFGG